MISAPSEMRCRSMSMNSMIGKMIATVSGIDSATTAPGRKPRLTMLHGHDDGDGLPQRFHEFADGVLDHHRLVGNQRDVDAERQVGHGGVERGLHVAAERQNVAAVAHGDGEADRRLAVDPEHRLRRIGQDAAHFGDVAQPDQAAVRQEIDVEQVVFGPERAGDADRQLFVAGLDRTGGNHGVLRLQRGDQRGAVDAEAGELPGREFDIDLLVLRAEDLDLGDVGNLQQLASGCPRRNRAIRDG